MDRKITDLPEHVYYGDLIDRQQRDASNFLESIPGRKQMNLRKADEMEKLLKDKSLDLDTKAKVDLIESIAHLRAGGDM